MTDDELRALDAYWRAANYLSVGQIYLLDNPLLASPCAASTSSRGCSATGARRPGLNFIYAHLNRVIQARDLDVDLRHRPGHGGPALVANAYLEGTYSELYPDVTPDEAGMRALFRQFSFPGGIPSHVAPETPGSIHEGGELGYSLSHAYGAAFDNPDLIVACVVGDGEAETGPLATSWHSNKFLNPASDGAVLPILHLNGYKIANPTVLARIPEEELHSLLDGYGYRPVLRLGRRPEPCTSSWPHPRRVSTRSPRSSRRAHRASRRPRVADDRPPHAEGLDRSEGSRRPAGRGNVAGAPGPARRGPDERGPIAPARGVAAELPAGGAVRRRRRAHARRSPRSRPTGERRMAANPRRTAASSCATSTCPTSATTQ